MDFIKDERRLGGKECKVARTLKTARRSSENGVLEGPSSMGWREIGKEQRVEVQDKTHVM